MIYTDELAASLDQIEGVVVFHRLEQTEVQRLAQQLAERAMHMVEQNEKTLDMKLGSNQDRGGAGAGAATVGAGRGRTERRGGTRGMLLTVPELIWLILRSGTYGGRGTGRGFQSGLGGAIGRRVPA